MTKATNVMSMAPNQPTTMRRLSPNTQPKSKTPARAGNKNFGATLDKVQSKLDELKQNIQDLQDTSKKLAQVEGEQPQPLDTATETPAQGTSDTIPQDAEKAISNAQGVMRNDSTTIADNVKPADIFFGKTESFDAIKIVDAPKAPTAQAPTIQPSTPRAQVQPVEIQPTAPIEAAPVSLDSSANLVDEQPSTKFIAANVPAYLFNTNTATLLETKPVAQAETPKIDGVQNLMSVMPQADNSNAQSMLNMLGGKAWHPFDIQAQARPIDGEQPATIQSSVQAQAQPIDGEQPAMIQPIVQAQAQPIDGAQPVNVTLHPVDAPEVPTTQTLSPRSEVAPQIQAQPIDVAQPVNVTLHPVDAPEVPTVQMVSPRSEVAPQIQAQPTDVQPATIQPTVQAQAQPIIAPQRVDERPAPQIFSEMLGVNVQVEDAPTAAPVTAPQAPPQQFNQQQRDAQQNFQGQNFQATTTDVAPQPQAVTTGGEVFAPNVTPQADAPQVQQTTPAQAPDAPPPMPQDDFDVPAQIIRQARLIRTTESTEMVIKLNPEHLGELTLRVSVSANGAVNASFHSDNAQVRTIIENALVQLRQELNDAGLKIEHVDVYAGLSEGGGLLDGQGGQAWQQGRQQRQGNRQTDLNTIERDVDATAPVNESTTDGVDYSV